MIEILEEIDMGDFLVYRNSSKELFVEIKSSKKIFRMKDLDGNLHIVASEIEIKNYGDCEGISLK